jgi:hypothetical protein
MTAEQRLTMLDIIRGDQRAQLLEWVKELNNPTHGYPGWFRYWVLRNVVRG